VLVFAGAKMVFSDLYNVKGTHLSVADIIRTCASGGP